MKSLASQMSQKSIVRDAIVMSGWNWETFNVPERISLAFACLGARVLYCENPVSIFRSVPSFQQEVEGRIFRTTLKFLGHRLNRIPVLLPQLQSELLVAQILRRVEDLRLQNPLFVYPHGNFVSLCLAFKKRDFFLVHICMDYPEPEEQRLIELSDITLLIPKSLYADMRTTYGDKIQMIPQVGRLAGSFGVGGQTSTAPSDLAGIPHPRLGYLGPVDRRLALNDLRAVLEAHPEWHFVHFGTSKCLPLKNVHVLAWRSPEKLSEIVAGLDLGFMPYACDDNKNLHCMPLKLLDYFAQGKPVVSTRILNLLEFSDTIYFGDGANELCCAVRTALDESSDSPLKEKRVTIARQNSIETLASVLAEVLAPRVQIADAAAI